MDLMECLQPKTPPEAKNARLVLIEHHTQQPKPRNPRDNQSEFRANRDATLRKMRLVNG